jgi:hypothetical protein
MWIVPISIGSTKDAPFLTLIRTAVRKRIIAYPQVIGKAVLITQAEVTRKKYQRRFGQILIYDNAKIVCTAWLIPYVLINWHNNFIEGAGRCVISNKEFLK